MQVIVLLPGPNCWWWETGSKHTCLGEILQEFNQKLKLWSNYIVVIFRIIHLNELHLKNIKDDPYVECVTCMQEWYYTASNTECRIAWF